MGSGMDSQRVDAGEDYLIDAIGVWKTMGDDEVVLTEIWGNGRAAMGYFRELPAEMRLWDRSTGWLLEKGKGIDSPSGDDRATLVTWVGDVDSKAANQEESPQMTPEEFLRSIGLEVPGFSAKAEELPAPSQADLLASMGLSFLDPAKTVAAPVEDKEDEWPSGAGTPEYDAEPPLVTRFADSRVFAEPEYTRPLRRSEDVVGYRMADQLMSLYRETKEEVQGNAKPGDFTDTIVEIPEVIHQALLGRMGDEIYMFAWNVLGDLEKILKYQSQSIEREEET